MAELLSKQASSQTSAHLYSFNEEEFYLEGHFLSPDGTKLLGINMTMTMANGQNIAYKDLMTGEFKRITQFDWQSKGHGYTYNPVWSPDGSKVAYNYHGFHEKVWELRVSDFLGNTRTVFTGEPDGKDKIYPCGWFPDGKSLLAVYITSQNKTQLGIVSLERGNFELVYEPNVPTDANFQPDARYYFQPDLSPDGRHVAFDLASGEDKNIYILDISAKSVQVLAESPAHESRPLWSPDGKTIAFLSNRLGSRAIWGIAVDNNANPTGQPFIISHVMAGTTLNNWTPQGIVYTNVVQMRDIYTMPIDPEIGAPASKPELLDFRPTGNNLLPIFSPDGEYIAFLMREVEGNPGRKVVVYSLADKEAKIFKIPSKNTWTFLADFRWLPDGSGISFSAEASEETPGWEEGTSDYRFFILDVKSGRWRTEDLGGNYHRCEWCGNGSYFYSKYTPSGDHLLVERDSGTGEERTVAELPKGMVVLKCSRDYRKIAATTRTNGIEIFDAASGNKLKEFPGFSLLAWSPDGSRIMAKKGNDLSYHVISYEDGTVTKYDLSENLVGGDRIQIDWSPSGDQIALSFRFGKVDAYILHNPLAGQ